MARAFSIHVLITATLFAVAMVIALWDRVPRLMAVAAVLTASAHTLALATGLIFGRGPLRRLARLAVQDDRARRARSARPPQPWEDVS